MPECRVVSNSTQQPTVYVSGDHDLSMQFKSYVIVVACTMNRNQPETICNDGSQQSIPGSALVTNDIDTKIFNQRQERHYIIAIYVQYRH